jgi:hypothetical protein
VVRRPVSDRRPPCRPAAGFVDGMTGLLRAGGQHSVASDDAGQMRSALSCLGIDEDDAVSLPRPGRGDSTCEVAMIGDRCGAGAPPRPPSRRPLLRDLSHVLRDGLRTSGPAPTDSPERCTTILSRFPERFCSRSPGGELSLGGAGGDQSLQMYPPAFTSVFTVMITPRGWVRRHGIQLR